MPPRLKVLLAYPPLPQAKGVPLLSQNRQFQWFSHPTTIYPVVMASAATLLQQQADVEVFWKDGIAEGMEFPEFQAYLLTVQPDLMVMETKTPVIQRHWQLIADFKKMLPKCRFALVGDHVTALPRESLVNCPSLDYVITGGDYDFSMLHLLRWLEGQGEPPPGLWYRADGGIQSTGHFQLMAELDSLPWVDRDLTQFHLYREFNIRRRPFAYTMAGRDCPYHRCSFCAWTGLYPRFRVRSPENILGEIGSLIERYGVREVFDDTGTFPSGGWLENFCRGMIDRGYHRSVSVSCNFRFDYLQDLDRARLMKKAGFRLLKMGLESANQETLDRIDKGITVESIWQGCHNARQAGLIVHLTIMVGWPWETQKDAKNTLNLARKLMSSGLADVLQSTVVVPYPGTPLFQQAIENRWFRIDPQDYHRYDMSEAILATPDMKPEEVKRICEGIYSGTYLSPRYIWRQLTQIRSWDDVTYKLRGFKAVLGHIRDFGRRHNAPVAR